MESMGGISEGEWSCLSGMYTIEDTDDFMSQLLNSFPIHDDDELDGFSNSVGIPSTFCSSASHIDNNYSLSSYSPIFVADHNLPMPMDFCMEGARVTSSYLAQPALPNNNLELKRETDQTPQCEPLADKNRNTISENSKKRCSSSGDHVRKKGRNSRSKKNKNNVEDGNDGLKGQSWTGCSSEDDSNASKGSGTDSQSLYAKKRRERINERLRILQNLVPNGTKVDISTMLEEAVQYVKFLQHQIKMLSSNDLWMYAPIAYNGMDINGLVDLNLPKQL